MSNSVEKKIELKDLPALVTETVLSVEGVSTMVDTLTDTIKTLSRISGQSHGVRISENEGVLSLDIYINAYYHSEIPDLAWEVQSAVKKVLESRTEYKVKEIDVHVQGVDNENDKEIQE